MILGIVVFAWVLCGVLAWGFCNGAHRAAGYNWTDPGILGNLFLPLTGPVGLLTVFFQEGFEHWSWGPMARNERWEIFKNNYSILVEKGYFSFENFDKK